MVDEKTVKSQYQGLSIKKDFIKMVQDHIDGDPRFTNVVGFVRFAVLNQIERDNKVNGSTRNYQPKDKGSEEKHNGW